MTPQDRLFTLLKNSKVFICALCLNIIFWEIFIRTFISSPCTQLYDEQLGYINKPLSNYIFTSEGYSKGKFNSLGFNDKEPAADNKRKFFFLGDSYTESFQVPQDKSFVQILEDRLNQDSNKKEPIDILKLGRDGFNPAHYPAIIKRISAKYFPETIIIQFWAHSGDDLYSDEVKSVYNLAGQLTALEQVPRIEDAKKESYRIIINNSALVYYLIRKYKSYIMGIVEFVNREGRVAKSNSLHKGKKSLADLESRLNLIFEEISKYQNGANILLFYIPEPGIYLEKGSEQKENLTLLALKFISEHRKINLIDFTPIFQKHYDNTHSILNGFSNTLPGKGHLNCNGHQLVSTHLYEQLK